MSTRLRSGLAEPERSSSAAAPSPRRSPFDFKHQHDFDLHIALEVPRDQLEPMLAKGREAAIESRGVSDHEVIESIYFRDPDGYVIELTAKRNDHDVKMNPAHNDARAKLEAWQAAKRRRGHRT